MVYAPATYRFSLEEFVRAWEAGAFDNRVELIDGEVWAVAIGDWHGATQMRVARALPNDRFEVTGASLASGSSLPDPDCWVKRRGAAPVAEISARLARWDPADVVLVVEVGDETLDLDLTVKAGVYGRAGYETYWVVSREGVYEHTGPTPSGYANRRLHRPGERIPVTYAGTDLAVSDLVAEL